MNQYDIIIIGAGPAGCCSALTLRNSTLKIALFEKDTFPRHKICGDGVCDRSINTLRKIGETYYQEFLDVQPKQCIKNTALLYKNKKFELDFKSFGYTCERFNFDNFLYNLVVRDCKNLDIFENTPIQTIQKKENGYVVSQKDGTQYFANMIIVANGAKSNIESQLTGIPYNKEKNGIAIRGYYKGVQDMKLDTIELHYKKEYFPGYFWIFPISKDIANVGFGYHLKDVEKYSESIQEILANWIQNDEILSKRFANAQLTSLIQGGLIPYNTNEFHCAGNNYMICGDAASLIDPISGGGIGSAMLSGHFAALQAEICCNTKNFSAQATLQYQNALQNRIQKEIKNRLRIQKVISKSPWLLDVLAFVGNSSKLVQRIKNWYVK